MSHAPGRRRLLVPHPEELCPVCSALLAPSFVAPPPRCLLASRRRRASLVARIAFGYWAPFSGARYLAALLAVAVAVAGCSEVPRGRFAAGAPSPESADILRIAIRADELYGTQPRRLPLVEESLALYWKAADLGAREYDVLWRGARAGTWAAQRLKDDEDEDKKVLCAERAIKLANTALEVDPARPEAYYYRAIASGLLASEEHEYGLDAMKVMVADGAKVLSIDERWNWAGGHRLLGNFYHKAPGPPIGKGSDRKSREHLERAVELAPEYGGNWIYLVQLDIEDEDVPRGREHLARFHQTVSPAGMVAEFEEWRTEAAVLATELNEIED